ncbi:ABC transporter permease [Microbulbifer spongiae]|uniref:ABC transporter permease n=1 Tax=Microbulbifer spongiae TaxID=2944933 RepID=A0ABY9EAK2_9GAMM|nr:ABC transporter permease [Microbulbifer sp. MI-G]WKD49192.1 ABC transporter permease [Microbulbifer sp. MI-G]
MNFADLQYSLRLLLKKPGFTLLTVFVMAIGIGLSLFLFSFLNTIMFKPLPFQDGASIVQISGSENGKKNNRRISLHDYYEIRNNVDGLIEFTAYRPTNLNVSGRDGARRYVGIEAEHNFFSLTRTQPILGRDFIPADNLPGNEYVTIIGYEIWQNQFGGQADILDQIIRINGISTRIIGVMPDGYFFPNNAELWIPLREDATRINRGDAGNVWGIAHMQSDATIEELNQQIALVMQRLQHRYPETNSGFGAYVETIQKATVGDGISVIYALYVVAILILLLSSVNVGNLLLSRAVERNKETAIRVALGAPRMRLIAQMLWESIMICLTGGVIGLIALWLSLEFTQGIIGSFFSDRPRFWWQFGIDSYALILFGIFVVSAIVVTGLVPAWKNSASNFNAVLRDGTRGALSKKSGRLNQLLVISEIFIAIMVLIAATVAVIGAAKAINADYGADPDNILTAKITLNEAKYQNDQARIQFYKSLQANLSSKREIEKVMLASALPGEFATVMPVAIEGKEYGQGKEDNLYPRLNYVAVMPGTLRDLGVSLVNGRYFDSSDDGLNNKTAIVTESFVDKYFNNADPIGKRIKVVDETVKNQQWLTVVGVVEHTIQGLANRTSRFVPTVFRPITQAPLAQMTIAMQMNADEVQMIAQLRKVLSSMDQELPAFRVEPYVERMNRNVAPLIFITSIFFIFGIAAAVLAASGIYGVMTNTINQRATEIGVKRALGATDLRIIKDYLSKSSKHLLWGGIPALLVGGGLGFVMSKVLASGGSSVLIITVIVVFSLIATIVLYATYLPTIRTLKMEPIESLRDE